MQSLVEKMRASPTIPYTLANAFESFFNAEGLGSEEERLALAAKVLQAFAR